MGDFWDDNTTWNLARLRANDISYLVERERLKPMIESGSILDIGCGDGKILAELANVYPKARRYGLSNRYEVAEARKNNPDADIRVGLFQNLPPFENDSIQLATTSNTFDYAEESLGLDLKNGTRLRIKPATFKLEDLAREVKRVLVRGGIYIPFEGGFEDYLSPDTWAIFERHFEPLHKETSGFKIFRKTF